MRCLWIRVLGQGRPLALCGVRVRCRRSAVSTAPDARGTIRARVSHDPRLRLEGENRTSVPSRSRVMRGSGSLSREDGDPHRAHLAQDPFTIENEDPPGVHDLPELLPCLGGEQCRVRQACRESVPVGSIYSPPFPCLTVVGRERGAGTSSTQIV